MCFEARDWSASTCECLLYVFHMFFNKIQVVENNYRQKRMTLHVCMHANIVEMLTMYSVHVLVLLMTKSDTQGLYSDHTTLCWWYCLLKCFHMCCEDCSAWLHVFQSMQLHEMHLKSQFACNSHVFRHNSWHKQHLCILQTSMRRLKYSQSLHKALSCTLCHCKHIWQCKTCL